MHNKIDAALRHVVTNGGAQRASLWLSEAVGGLRALRSLGQGCDQLEDLRLPPRRGIVQAALECPEGVVVANVRNDPNFFPGVDRFTGNSTINTAILPVCVDGVPLGAIQAANLEPSLLTASLSAWQKQVNTVAPYLLRATLIDIANERYFAVSPLQRWVISNPELAVRPNVFFGMCVVCDVVGSSRIGELSFRKQSQFFSIFESVASECLDNFHGFRLRFEGDCVKAFFPVLNDVNDDKLRVLKFFRIFSTQLRERLREILDPCELRCGVSLGEVTILAQPHSAEPQVLGMALGKAVKIGKSADVGQIVFAEQDHPH